MLRIGRYVNCYRSIIARLNKKPEEREYNDVIRSLSDTFNSLYLMLDHILLVSKLNVIKMEPSFISRVDFYCNIAWLGDCFFNLIYDFVDFNHIITSLRNFESDLKKIEHTDSKGNF